MSKKEQMTYTFEKDVLGLGKRLYKFLRSLCKDEELCKDLVQETLLRAQRSFVDCSYDDDSLIWRWLRTIAHNVWRTHYRTLRLRQHRMAEGFPILCENLGWGRMNVPSLDAETQLSRRAVTRNAIEANIGLLFNSKHRFFGLSLQERQLIQGRHLQMKSFKELSRESGLSLSTTMSRYYKAMKKVQQQIFEWEELGVFEKGLSLPTLQRIKQLELITERRRERQKHKKTALQRAVERARLECAAMKKEK